MAIDCGLINKNYYDIVEAMDKFDKSKRNRSYFKDPLEAAVKLFETEFNSGLEEMRQNPDLTAGQASSFKARLKELSESVRSGQIDSRFAQFFWQTSHHGKKDPVIGSVLNRVQNSGFYFQANTVRDKNLLKSTLTNLLSHAGKEGLMSKLGVRRADKALQKLDEQYIEARVKFLNKEPNAQKELFRVQNERDRLVADTHLKVYDDFITLVEGVGREVDGKVEWESGLPKLAQDKYNSLPLKQRQRIDEGKEKVILNNNDYLKLKMADGTSITEHTNMFRALESYVELTDGLYGTLRNGVDKRIDSIIKKLEYNGDNLSAQDMKNIREKLRGKLMPKYEIGFFPHYTRDLNVNMMDGLMPMFEDMQTSVNPYNKSANKKPIRNIINDMNTYIDGHTKRRIQSLENGEFDYAYSRNLFNSISNYVYDVNRFNYASYMDAHMLDGLMAVERIYQTDGMAKGYGESLTNYLSDLHLAANGNSKASESTKAVMRTLLGFEFISKLGTNPRAAARNAFQRLLDVVMWGPVQMGRMKRYLKNMHFEEGDSEAYVENVLKKAGLYFQEASPEFLETGLQSKASMFKVISWNDATNKFESHKKSRIERVAETVSIVAAKSSWLHRWAENSNRKNTFKLGYAQMHRWLNTPDYKSRLLEQSAETERGKKRIAEGRDALSRKEINSRVRKKAENYAKRMVIMNHFDYADYAKSKMMRTGVGRFMFQFQHFGMEFLERNISIAREAKHDVLNGKFFPTDSAQGLQKAYRMSFAYFLAPVIASALTGLNFGNLVEHDTANRIKQYVTLLTGDDDEIQEAFYGRGPIIATFGGPITSDIIDIGVMMDLINLDDDSLLTLITGLEKYDPSNQSTEVSKKLRILNTFAGRLVERHIPQMQKGRLGFALKSELGVYPTAEARKIQRMAGLEPERKTKKRTKKTVRKLRAIPQNLEESLRLLQGR